MATRLFVVTGSSRGLGARIAARLLADAGHTVIGLARGEQADAAAIAEASGARFESWRADLAEPLAVAARLERRLADDASAATFDTAVLINNAALVARPGALEAVEPDELSRALRVGLEAPMLLSAAFLRATRAWRADRRVLNISSGLGQRAMAGQAPYCAVKAGLDHASRAIALDQAGRSNGARIVSLAPGVIDTDMQKELRGAGDEGFPDRSRFVEMKAAGQLASADDVARRVLDFLFSADFGGEPVADVRGA